MLSNQLTVAFPNQILSIVQILDFLFNPSRSTNIKINSTEQNSPKANASLKIANTNQFAPISF